MFGLFKRKSKEPKESAPEVLGLHLSGNFKLNKFRLANIEEHLTSQDMNDQHIIEAVGQVNLDATSKVLRFYTDDDGFLQVNLDGDIVDQNVSGVTMWYFFDTQNISSEADWDKLLSDKISQPEIEFNGMTYQRAWQDTSSVMAPVAMTEKTYTSANEPTTTDQFVMLYSRYINEDLEELLLISAEESIHEGRLSRCFVRSTGFHVSAADLETLF